MKVVIAFDKFKGSLDAAQACRIAADEIAVLRPHARVAIQPLADGGEGTAAALIEALSGEWIPVAATGPLSTLKVDAGYGWLPRPGRCVVEMASASGLVLLPPDKRDPLRTSTYGTGELLAAAFTRRVPTWLAVGGSATVDGGVGAAMALGWTFLDKAGKPVRHGGAELERIERIVPPAKRDYPPVEVLCDVRNPLLGPQGAARVYGPQKGATPRAVERLEAGLARLADAGKRDLGVDVSATPGGGAAGGLSAGAVLFLGAKLVSGAETVMEATGLDAALDGADWVLTGEGSFDEQSLQGKVVASLAERARKRGARVAVIAGRATLDAARAREHGVEFLQSLASAGISTEYAMTHAADLLAGRVREWIDAHLPSQAN